MIAPPLVERELRIAARQAATYWARFGAASLVGVIVGSMLLASRPWGSPAQLGHAMFAVLSYLALGYCLLAGVRYTADCLSSEKRQGTLGLLFLTDLRGYDVVLGKLAVTSLRAVYGLLATFPMLALPVLLGGVTGNEFWRLMLVLLSTLMFSLAAGMLVSAIGYEERQVMLATFLALLLVVCGCPALWKFATWVRPWRLFDLLFLLPNPAYAFRLSTDVLYRLNPGEFWLAWATTCGLAVGGLIVASLLLPRVFQEKGRWGAGSRWQERWHRWRFGPLSRRQQLLEQIGLDNPFLWLVSRDRLPQFCAWILALSIVGFGIWTNSMFSPFRSTPMALMAVNGSFFVHLLVKFLVASAACSQLGEDRRSGALAMLLSTPLWISDILEGQFTALRRQFRAPLGALIALNLLLIAALHEREPGWVIFGGAIAVVPDFVALSWVGTWLGLKSSSHARAVLATMGRVMGLPWAVLFLFIFSTMNRGVSSSTLAGFFFLWYLGGLVLDYILMFWARCHLQEDLRSLATQPFTPDKPPVPLTTGKGHR